MDTETGSLVLLKETEGDTDTIYTGTWKQNEDGEAEFNKDGGRKSFSEDASNIREVSGELIDGIAENDVQNKGLVFNEGYLQVGLEVMEFISFKSEIELSAWSFNSEAGSGLSITPWYDNDASTSRNLDLTSKVDSEFVTDVEGNRLGTKRANIHTHPGSKSNPFLGFGQSSDDDKTYREAGVNSNYPFYINSRYDNWKPF